MSGAEKNTGQKAEVYKVYPPLNILIYDGVTIVHYLLAGFGILWGFDFLWIAFLLAGIYLLFAFGQMYVMMPLVVCPNCVYYRMAGSRCISGMNAFSRKIAKPGKPKNFPRRGKGLFCHNQLYIASFASPLVILLPALIMNFSFVLLGIFILLIGLLLLRFFVIFPKVACIHCYAKYTCPNGKAMGVDKL